MLHRLSGSIALLKFLYLQRVRGFPPPGDEPFMDAAGIARFKEEISKASRYVEFGSGGSTVVADRAGIEVISVENDPYYARAVASRLKGGAVRQIVVHMGITGEWGFPMFPTAKKARRYVTAPWVGSPFPDFVLVDGRYRVACALESARRAHLSGAKAVLMFDDYVPRPQYHVVESLLGKPEIVGRSALFQIGKQPVTAEAVEAWHNAPG